MAKGQIFQRLALAGPMRRPRSKVENSVAVPAPLRGHFVPAVVVASDCMPAMLNFLACAWKFRRAACIQVCDELYKALSLRVYAKLDGGLCVGVYAT